MNVSENGYELIRKYEGCRLKAYKCPSGKWTIGYGHTKGVNSRMYISKEVANYFLVVDVQAIEPTLQKWDSIYHWTQNEFDALASFTFNCGVGNFKQLIANGKRSKDVIASKMLLYNKSNGKTLNGLVKRRKEEYKLFTKK